MSTVNLTKIISSAFTDDVLQEILKTKSGFSNVTVRNINLGASSNKGDSYLSTVTRFTAEASGNNGSENNQNFEVHVIVKSIPFVPARIKTFRSKDFFQCELSFYNKVWPLLDSFQRSKNVPNLFDSIPLCVASYCNGINDFIALDDLSYQGYTNFPRSECVDLKTASFILKHFAQFHALSIACRDQRPKEFMEVVNNLQETYFDEKFRKWYTGAFNQFLIVAKDAAEKELPASYLEKLNEVTLHDVFGNISKLLKTRTPLSAITHGDCWIPNFLVKHTEKDSKLAIIDFQLLRYASLTTDILFIFYTCVDALVRNEHWNTLLEEYYKCFMDTLRSLGSNLDISLDMIKKEMKTYGLFAFGMCNESLIMSLMEDEDVADLDDIKGDEEIPVHEVWKIQPIKDKKKRQRVADYLKHLIDNEFI